MLSKKSQSLARDPHHRQLRQSLCPKGPCGLESSRASLTRWTPITPFYGNDEFARLSPLRRVPVLIDGDFSTCNSSVICGYLDETYPGHSLFPANSKDRARARWYEEYADTRLGDLFIWSLFYQKIVRPLVWGEPGDEARIAKSLKTRTFLPHSTIWSASCLPTAFFLATSGSPTSQSQPSFEMELMRAFTPMPPAGLGQPPSSIERSGTNAFGTARVRGRAAQRRDEGPPTSAARRRRTAHERYDGPPRAVPRNDAALAANRRLRTSARRVEYWPWHGFGASLCTSHRNGFATGNCLVLMPRGIQCSRRVRSDRFEGM